MMKGYRIPKEQLGCKFNMTYWEDVAGDGGSKMQMFDCAAPERELTPEEQNKMNNLKNCSNECPCFEPAETRICTKHDIEYLADGDWCSECFPEGE